MGKMIGRNADTIVAHGHQHVVPWCDDGRFLLDVVLVELHGGRFNGETAPLRHGIPGVGGEVHQDLLDLNRIDADAIQFFPGDEGKFDVLADEAVKRPGDVGDDGIQVDDPEGLHLLAAEGEQLPG